MIARWWWGATIAAAIARGAGHVGSLAPSGEVAAIVVGTLAVRAGWGWGAVLVLYFLLTSWLTRAGRAEKARRTAEILPEGGRRTAQQVLANGGVFAFLLTLPESPAVRLAALGALAAAAADTWATEIGTRFGGTPRHLFSGAPLPPGLSGGVTLPGSLAAIAGAVVTASAAPWLVPAAGHAGVVAVATAGVLGAFLDSALGATVQSRRRCPRCGGIGERARHCDSFTEHTTGWRWMTNDLVNFSATVGGALLAFGFARP